MASGVVMVGEKLTNFSRLTLRQTLTKRKEVSKGFVLF